MRAPCIVCGSTGHVHRTDCPKQVIFLAGMVCLKCGWGRYGYGYTKDHRTLPCDKCGDSPPAALSRRRVRLAIAERMKART